LAPYVEASFGEKPQDANFGGVRHLRKSTSRDTRYPKHVKVWYPLHPLHGQTLPIVQEDRHGVEHQLLVQGSDRCHAIPAWMADPRYCARLTVGWQPVCDGPALLRLRQLLEAIDQPA
jgi:hypothetical protein